MNPAQQTEAQAAAPEWVQLIAAGPDAASVDGHSLLFDSQAARAIQSRFTDDAGGLPITWEQANVERVRDGAPLAGRIRALQVRGGALWARVTWSAQAAAQLAAREYRYLSAVCNADAVGSLSRLLGAFLTNTPGLRQGQRAGSRCAANRAGQLTEAERIVCKATDVSAAAFLATRAQQSEPREPRGLSEVAADVCRATGIEPAAFAAAHATPNAMPNRGQTMSPYEQLTDSERAVCKTTGIDPSDFIEARAPAKGEPGRTWLSEDELAICNATGIHPADFIATRDSK